MPENKNIVHSKRSPFEWIMEIFGWLQIAASPFLIGLIIGLITYFSITGPWGLVIGIITTLAGLVIGIVWATNIWKTNGTHHYVSSIMATPELDDTEEDKSKNETQQAP